MKKWIAVIGVLVVMFFGLYAYASVDRSQVQKDGYYQELEEGWFFGSYLLDDNSAWAVGSKGMVYSRNGSDWTKQGSVTDKNLFGVYGSSPNDVWVTGVSGTLLHFDGEWSERTMGAGTLNSVSGTDKDHVWVVGEAGIILFYNGSQWIAQDSGVEWNLKCVSALDSGRVWAAGSGGILSFDGQRWNTVWQTQPSGLFPGIYGIYAESENRVWAVGSAQGGFSSSVLMFDGRKWEVVYDNFGAGLFTLPEGAFEPLRSVYAYEGKMVAVGKARYEKGIVLTGDGCDWEVTEVKGSLFWNVSGYRDKILGVGFHSGHDNLKNDTTYNATVFDINNILE